MSTQSQNSSLLDLEPDTLIELYEIDLGEQDGLYRFHPGKNNLSDIILSDDQGVPQTYYAMPIETDGWEMRGDGQLPHPKLILSNPQGVITDAIKRRSDLIGNNIIRKRIFLKYLDGENFPNDFNPFAIPDPEARFDDDIYVINRKVQENKYFIEFELISPLELEDVKVPARVMIANYCPWVYRGDGCLYGRRPDFKNQHIFMPNKTLTTVAKFFEKENGMNLGIPIADENNKKFSEENGYNLTLVWQGEYDKNTVSVTANGAATQSVVTIDNSGGYTSSATSITVDAVPVIIPAGSVIEFTNGAEFTLSAQAAASATTLSGFFSPQSIVANNEEGNVQQNVVVDALSAEIEKDRTIVFSGGTTLKLSRNAAKGDVSILGVLSASLTNDQVGELKYVAGDCVKIGSKVKNLSKQGLNNTQENLLARPDLFFVCIAEVATSKDPRYAQSFWRGDQCGKNLKACKCRYLESGEYNKGLPFGGFPSIEKYRF